MTREEFLKSSGLKLKVLELWIEQEWLVPEQTVSGPRFREIDVARARLIRELQSGIGANEAGIDVILHLMDQLHGMRRALAELRREMGAPKR
ncbi:MAG: MerR family transcriptional regulator [Rhizobiaceae bacterium]|nr:MerR family transcriptional regulator [Rhizobiaceae bacterium]